MLKYRFFNENDIDLLFNWANDSIVRKYSYNSNPISYKNHCQWFKTKIYDPNCIIYIFYLDENKPIGQVRIEINNKTAVIGILIDSNYRKKSFAHIMLEIACNNFFIKYPLIKINAFIKKENSASLKSFIKAGFKTEKNAAINNIDSIILYKNPYDN